MNEQSLAVEPSPSDSESSSDEPLCRSMFMSTTVHTVTSISSQSGHPLHCSFIADNRVDMHIVNRYYQHRFQDFRPAKPGHVLLHGNTSTPIQDFDTAYFVTKDLSGATNQKVTAQQPKKSMRVQQIKKMAQHNLWKSSRLYALAKIDETPWV
ncbi:hypothetical protein VTO42DRAFT_1416 [Malbranchea cinnamomea]